MQPGAHTWAAGAAGGTGGAQGSEHWQRFEAGGTEAAVTKPVVELEAVEQLQSLDVHVVLAQLVGAVQEQAKQNEEQAKQIEMLLKQNQEQAKQIEMLLK